MPLNLLLYLLHYSTAESLPPHLGCCRGHATSPSPAGSRYVMTVRDAKMWHSSKIKQADLQAPQLNASQHVLQYSGWLTHFSAKCSRKIQFWHPKLRSLQVPALTAFQSLSGFHSSQLQLERRGPTSLSHLHNLQADVGSASAT